MEERVTVKFLLLIGLGRSEGDRSRDLCFRAKGAQIL